MEKPFVQQTFQLEKFPGKGGWTYVVIPKIKHAVKGPLGMVRVKGLIDNFEINQYNLMPMKDGNLFLPIRAEIRKQIRKKEGDQVTIVLYADHSPLHIPEELKWCLQDVPAAYETFLSYPESEQKMFIHWITSAKTDQTKVSRIAQTLDKITRKLKFNDKI